MQVTISASSIGGNAGPFTITDNLSNTVATNISRATILAGYVATVNDSATSLTLTSSGTCTNQTVILISSNLSSCSEFTSNNLYLTVTPSGSYSTQTNSGVYGNSGYCGDNQYDYSYYILSFYKNSNQTVPYYLSNIRVDVLQNNTGGSEILVASASLSTGTLTSNNNTLTFGPIMTAAYEKDVDQSNNCINVNSTYGIDIVFGCSSVSTVTIV